MKGLRLCMLLAAGGFAASVSFAAAAEAPASGDVTVVQDDRSFHPDIITITKGTVVHFENDDEFIHQIYVASPGMSFDSAEQEPGKTIDLQFPDAGSFEMRCHIHPKMHLLVIVK